MIFWFLSYLYLFAVGKLPLYDSSYTTLFIWTCVLVIIINWEERLEEARLETFILDLTLVQVFFFLDYDL